MPMDAFDRSLLNDFQRGFPLCPQPFRVLARALRASESSVLDALARLQREGKVSRVGAIFRPRTIGASTLAAMAVPEPRLAEVAALVNAHPEVNHNYSRSHDWNLWIVVTAPDSAQLARTLDRIESECGYRMIRLPLIDDYHIDLGFDLEGAASPRIAALATPAAGPISLCQKERALVAALEAGLPLVPQPYADLGTRAGMNEAAVIATLKTWIDAGIVARLGVIVRHHELGYTANAMAVWDVPDNLAGVLGRRLAAADCVTLCYRRARDLPRWRYNLYCMIHGRSHERVLAQIEWLRESRGMLEFPSAVLFSRQRFKQRGARYVPQAEPAHG